MRGSPFKCAGALAGVSVVALAAIAGFADTASARNRSRNVAQVAVQQQQELAGTPVMAVVSLKSQRVSVYDAHGNVLRSPISSGQSGLDTPSGIYSVIEKEQDHVSNIFEGAEMPFMQRITWSGVALHAGVIPGYPASHGCVRMPYGFAQRLYPLTKLNMRVVINYADVAPVPFSHPLLMKPLPPNDKPIATPAAYENDGIDIGRTNPFQPDVRNWPNRQAQMDQLRDIASEKKSAADEAVAAVQELKPLVVPKALDKKKADKVVAYAQAVKAQAQDKLNKADRVLLAAKNPKAYLAAEAAKAKLMPAYKDADAKLDVALAQLNAANRALQAVNAQLADAEAHKAASAAAAREAMGATQPVSVFISLKTKRLYVRQGNEAMFDAPVTIADPATPIGTHIFTATDYTNDARDLRWTVVSIGKRTSDDIKGPRVASLAADAPATDAAKATAALDRITIPADVSAKISGYVWPGSSLIVSDEEASAETGKGTDFIVLISGEPQGGIKRRPKPAPSYRRDSWSYDDDYDYDRRGRRYKKSPGFFFWN